MTNIYDPYHTSQSLSKHKAFKDARLHSEIEHELVTNQISLTPNQISLVVELLKIDTEEPEIFREFFKYLKLHILFREVGGIFHEQINNYPSIKIPGSIMIKFSKIKTILDKTAPSYNNLLSLDKVEECIERMKESGILILDSNDEIQSTSPFFTYLTYVELYNNVLRSNANLK